MHCQYLWVHGPGVHLKISKNTHLSTCRLDTQLLKIESTCLLVQGVFCWKSLLLGRNVAPDFWWSEGRDDHLAPDAGLPCESTFLLALEPRAPTGQTRAPRGWPSSSKARTTAVPAQCFHFIHATVNKGAYRLRYFRKNFLTVSSLWIDESQTNRTFEKLRDGLVARMRNCSALSYNWPQLRRNIQGSAPKIDLQFASI